MSNLLKGSDRRLRRELYALTELSKTLTLPLELPELLQEALNKVTTVLQPAEVGLVMLWDQSAGLFRPVASVGYENAIIMELGLRAGESITGKVYDLGKTQILSTPEDVAIAMADMREANRAVLARALGSDDIPISSLAAPISVGDQKYGVLYLGTICGPTVFTSRDLSFIQTIADLIALAIDRARLEVRAEALRDEHQAEIMRSEIMAMLSHELRLPLTAIQGYSSALLLEDVEWNAEKQHDFLQRIDDECRHMEAILKNILDSSLIEIDQFKIEKEPVRLQLVAHDVAYEIQQRTELHRILVDFPADFPILEADPRWIKQVFRNVLDNAIKYSPDGGLVVIRAESRLQDVVITVADQGIGISPEDLIPLFEKFFRVRSNHHLHVPGTGLGLPITRRIIEAHGGRIWVESKISEGTTLHFSLPLPDQKLHEEP